MVYIYYMKNNIICFIAASVLLFFPALAGAQATVVRVDGQKVYLDTTSLNRSVQKGEIFKVILSSEKLVNPKTGKNLGDIYTYSPEGKIVEVQPMYAVGELPEKASASVGQEAVIEAAAPSAPVYTRDADENASSRQKIVYAPVEQEIISLTQADITAPGAQNFITLSADGKVTVWSRAEKDTLAEQLSYTVPSAKRAVTLSAAPVKEGGLAQIFVSVYDPSRSSVSALVLENENGALQETASLPYFVKELGCGKDKKIWAQKPFVSAARPGNAREVAYQNGKYTVQKDMFSTQRNWLTGLNRYDVENAGADNLIYTSSNGTVRLTLQNGKRAESKDLFAAAPNRVKYKQEIVKFYPSVQVFGHAGDATVAAVENTSKLGLLSETFGQYQSGKIHFLTFEKGRLSLQDTVNLDGVVYDTACSDRAVLAAEVLPDGSSSVVEIFK